MKFNKAKKKSNKKALLQRTDFSCTLKRFASQKLQTEKQMRPTCVLDCIYSIAQIFFRRCVLYRTPDSTYMLHFKLKIRNA